MTEKNLRKLAIDDCRECGWVNVLARTYQDGIDALTKMGPWDELYLDHDLCAVETHRNEHGREMTGYDVLCFLEANPQYLPGRIVIISSNPVGIEKMRKLIHKLYPDEKVPETP